ncbi:MAG: hypothetical protein ACI4JQ_02065 [Ruminococcus sp.]
MGLPVLILGESGSGKSASLRNFDPAEIGVFNVASKPLPFRKMLMTADGAGYPEIVGALSAADFKRYAIDDSQYLLVFEFFEKAKEIGYGKFTDMALNFFNLVRYIQFNTPTDCIVYFLHHVETAYDASGNKQLKAKTIGKMLDEKLTLEGLFSIVLLCRSDSTGRHYFQTQSNGNSTAKSPMEMFPTEIDNDLKMVDDAIRDYYGLPK